MDTVEREAIRRLCLQSLYHFVKIIIGHSGQGKIINQTIHKPILDFTQNQKVKRKGILMPRGFLKSTTVTKSKPIWDWLRNHEERILIANETFTSAKLFMAFVKQQIEQNELLHYIYPETKLTDDWKKSHRWSSEELDLPRKGVYSEPSFSVIGVGGAAQGRHFTKIYLDDIIGKAARDSDVVRDDTERWYHNVKELLDIPDIYRKDASELVVIGTHWGPGDIYSKIMAEDKDFIWKVIPAETEEGIPTWPEKYSAEYIKKMKESPDDYIIFYTQYQNNPMATDLTDFKRQWLHYFDYYQNEDGETAIRYIDAEQEPKTVLLSDLEFSGTIDPAFSEGGMKKTSRTAIVVVGTDKATNTHFIVESWAKRISEPEEMYKQVVDFHSKYRCKRWGMEIFSQQQVYMKGLEHYAGQSGIHVPLMTLPRDTGKNAKDTRIRTLADDFSQNRVYLHQSMNNLLSEYYAFPMGSTNDILDALAYHKTWWSTKKRKEVDNFEELSKSRYMEGASSTTGY